MSYDPNQVADGAEVTVVTGTQFTVNAPPASSTTSTSSATTPTTAPTSQAITAPSSSNPKLAPWDPRACPAKASPTAPVSNRT